MTRYHLTLYGRVQRLRALEQLSQLVEKAPDGTRVEVKAAKRTMPQNDKMWAMLTEVSLQVKWHGQRLRPDDWKLIFLDGLDRETRMVPSIDGDGVVNLNVSSSDLTIAEMGDLIELIHMFGANHGVVFADDCNQREGHMLRQRHPRQHDADHLAFVRQLPCLICGDDLTVEAAHVSFADLKVGKEYRGNRQKVDDIWAVPLCGRHHTEQHTMNERDFWHFTEIDPIRVAMALALNSGDYITSVGIINANRGLR